MRDPDQDRLAIEALLYDYCDGVDRADLTVLAEVFAPDASLDYGFGRVFHGREQILGLLRDRLRNYAATSHHASNVRIHLEADGDRGRCSSYVYAFHELVDTGEQLHVWGRYDDEVALRDGRWQLTSRRIRAAGEQGFAVPEGLPSAFERPQRDQLAGEDS